MNKLVQLGRKAWFMVRLLTGYEERQIRAYRLQLQNRMELAQARKEALSRVSEQAILTEVRRMVEQMQELNNMLDETEKAIEEHLKPLDRSAQILMDMQMQKEEEQAKMIASMAKQQYMMRKEMAMKQMLVDNNEALHSNQSATDHINQEHSK